MRIDGVDYNYYSDGTSLSEFGGEYRPPYVHTCTSHRSINNTGTSRVSLTCALNCLCVPGSPELAKMDDVIISDV